MQDRYTDRRLYFDEQAATTQNHVIPFILTAPGRPLGPGTAVLEIGCGEGGNLLPFARLGCQVVGVDLNPNKIANAQRFFADEGLAGQAQFFLRDIFDWQCDRRFDVVVLRDVLEHIHGHERFLERVKDFLAPEGRFFVGFPPWRNPYGGHQQICASRLGRMPYIHILPNFIYVGIMKLGGETPRRIEEQLETKQTRLGIDRFNRLVRRAGYAVAARRDYLINPNYEVKFGLRPRRQLWPLRRLPWLRDFATTTCYVVLTHPRP